MVAQGGAFGGWSVYVKGGKPKYCYNLFGLQRFTIQGETAIPPGTHQVRMEFTYDGGGLAKGGAVKLFVDGNEVGQGRSRAPCRCSSPPTKPAILGPTSPLP